MTIYFGIHFELEFDELSIVKFFIFNIRTNTKFAVQFLNIKSLL